MPLAQLNIATTLYPIDSPEMADFVNNLAPINAIAEASAGFIWRLQDDSGDATHIHAFDDPNMIVNMSVWESIDALKAFMFKTHHRDFMRRKKEWFQHSDVDTYVLWWIPQGYAPSLDEAISKLTLLRDNGESPSAFTFKRQFSEDEFLSLNQHAM